MLVEGAVVRFQVDAVGAVIVALPEAVLGDTVIVIEALVPVKVGPADASTAKV